METSQVNVKWVDGLQFVANNNRGHSVVMDHMPGEGEIAHGPIPMELLLAGIGACTAMDVISILKKQRQKVLGFEIVVKGERRKDPPMIYSKIHVEYVVKGHNIDPKKLEKAIALSVEKYCSVGAMLRAAAKVTESFRIEEMG